MNISFLNFIRYLLVVLLTACYALPTAHAEAAPFYPNWKLLKKEEKTQFIAGYLRAWEDAQRTLEVVEQYVSENPQSAHSSVKKIRKIYDFTTLRADTVVREVDAFYGEAKNHTQPLSIAVTAARSKLR